MRPHEFSWFKILSFFGAALALFFGFVNGGSGGILISNGHGFNGSVTLISALGWIAVAVYLYLNYEKKTRAGQPGVKIEDINTKH